MEKTVSVCLASYNGERYILDQVRSILPQLGRRDELIVSDDGSQDRTLDLLDNIGDRRIQVIRREGRAGVTANFEAALSLARGDLVFLSDQDDIWEPDKVRVMRGCLRAFHLVLSDCVVIDSEGRILHESYFSLRRSGKGLLRNLLRNSYMGCCMGFRRDLLERALPFPKEAPMHDWWIGLAAEMTGQVCFCPDKLTRYRRHSDNQSPLAGHSQYNLKEKMNFRITLAKGLCRLWMANLKEKERNS